jgi:hypothetical protein
LADQQAPDHWARHNWIPFDRFKSLDRARMVHGTLTGVDLSARTVAVGRDDGPMLDGAGVVLHPGHRAKLADGFTGDQITSDPVEWSTGQPQASADAVLWTIGRVRPNTDWLPSELLDEHGFVRVTPH